MKSRSNRHDDWVEESWTVDCVCGVNFDDGEEMVNCDECGVWVHTRCSRYVKTEKVFACDKCKNKNNTSNAYNNNSSRNDSEETEVAQLLVELPTKTLRMENYNPSRLPPARRPFRLWTDIPIEERVHVQGVPGGEPGLLSGLSSVFGPQLWKCTGYVPKKFNFQYKEFPGLDDQEELLEKESLGRADNGAGALLSLSKEDGLPAPSEEDAIGVKGLSKDSNALKNAQQVSNNLVDVSRPQNGVNKDQSLLQSSGVLSGKRKKEDFGVLRDRIGKKKTRIMEKEGDFKKKALHTPGTAPTNSSDGKKLQFYEDRGPKAVESDPQNGKNAHSISTLPADQLSHDPGLEKSSADDGHRIDLASSKIGLEKSTSDASVQHSRIAEITKEDNGLLQVPAKLEGSSKISDATAPLLERSDSGSLPLEEQVVSDTVDNANEIEDGLSVSVLTESKKSESVTKDGVTSDASTKDNQNPPDSSIKMVASCKDDNAKGNAKLDDKCGLLNIKPSPIHDAKLDASGIPVQYQEVSARCLSENVRIEDSTITVSEASNKAEDVGRCSEVVDTRKDRVDVESPVARKQPRRDSEGVEDSLGVKKSSTGFGLKCTDEPSKPSGTIPSPPMVGTGECKVLVSLGSSTPASSTVVMSKSSASQNHASASIQNQDTDIKQKGISESNLGSNNDNAGDIIEEVKGEESHERPKKLVTELPKPSISYVSKSSQSKKVLHASLSRRTSSDSKESMLHSASKSSSVPNSASTPNSEPAGLVQAEGASNVQKKASALQTEIASGLQKKVVTSVSFQKSEKVNQAVSLSSSKGNASLTNAVTSSNCPATLSDEELALLLHQELNSSPRVPRVPRMRHAGSLPQLTSPTATSTLMKRTSSSGGKDHGLTFRRKTKDFAKDGSHGSREVDDETQKMDRISSSLDQGRQDSTFSPDSVGKREADSGSAKGGHSLKKFSGPTSGATASNTFSSPAEINEHNLSSARHSPRNPSEDDKGVVGRPSHRTLPALIAEIMSKGKRMTYEELCNSVLPHWPYLRKHNGERYAYSSHSQAVLDCLRNRSEWARLVDRGPKTSGGRKRRKLDADNPDNDSEDNDDGRERKDARSKSIGPHEEFPKGKRKARKRRRLALQGRGIKDVRRRRRIEELSDDEADSFTNSSEDTVLSEDESQGGGTSAAGAEVSASSDRTGDF